MKTKHTTDISALDGEALFNALTSGHKIKVTEPVKKTIPLIDPWIDRTVVLIVHKTHCLNCGATFSIPNTYLLIKQELKKVPGTFHYQSLEHVNNLEDRCNTLSRTLEYSESDTPCCAQCFEFTSPASLVLPARPSSEPGFTIDNPPSAEFQIKRRGKENFK